MTILPCILSVFLLSHCGIRAPKSLIFEGKILTSHHIWI